MPRFDALSNCENAGNPAKPEPLTNTNLTAESPL